VDVVPVLEWLEEPLLESLEVQLEEQQVELLVGEMFKS
jgi:hypothetical protein